MKKNPSTKAPKPGKPSRIQSASGAVTVYATGETFTLSWQAGGMRKREKRTSWPAAQTRANEILSDLDTGTAHVRSFTAKEAALIESVIDLLKPLRTPLSTAVREYVEAKKNLGDRAGLAEAVRGFLKHEAAATDTPQISFEELGREFLLAAEKRGLSERYLDDCRKHLANINRAIGTMNAPDISAALIEESIEQATSGGARAFNNIRGTVCAVFSFGQRRGYIPADRKTQAALVDKRVVIESDIEIYSPGEFSAILHGIDPRLVPAVALGGLAGIRTSEIFRMSWEQIDFHKGFILLNKQFTKTRRRRIIPICDTLRAWIEPLAGEGRLYPCRDITALENLLRAHWPKDSEGKTLPKRKNGLRHSYGTYRFALLQDEARVSSEMGNSPGELRTHYAELATPEQAKEWFAVTPRKSARKIVRFAA
jgi:integrase